MRIIFYILMPEKFYEDNLVVPVKEKYEPPQELLRKLKIIAQAVGGDFGMNVEIGTPGKGSYFNPENKEIKFDPLHFKEGEEWRMEFIAGHEGGHRAIDRSPRAIGGEEIEKQWEELGWGYLSNCLADCADNNFVSRRWPAFAQVSQKNYEEIFTKENAILGNPQVHALIAALGKAPKFAQFGSELMRYWFKNDFSQRLDAKVKEALDKAFKPAQKIYETLPANTAEPEVMRQARERYFITRRQIWPLMKELVEEDEINESLRQMIKNAQFKPGQGKQGGEGGAPLELPPELQKELEEKIKEAQEKYEESLKKQEQELKEKLKQAQENQEGSSEKKDGEQGESGASEEKDKKEKSGQKEDGEKVGGKDGLDKERLAKEIKDLKKSLEKNKQAQKDLAGEETMPLDTDDLSDELKEKLKENFSKLPHKDREDLKDKAKEKLKEIEDELNKEMEGKLDEEKPQSHKERREEKNKVKEGKDQTQKNKKINEAISRAIEGKLTEYQKAFREVKPIIDKTYKYLEKFFIPQRHPRFMGGYDSGSRAQTQKAMQFEAKSAMHDSSAKVDFWERKTKPHKIDYKFSLLIDLSSSMDGSKIQESFKGIIVLAEVLNRLNIDFEILGFGDDFSDKIYEFKRFGEKYSEANRNESSKIASMADGGTPAGQGLEKASIRLAEAKGKDSFLIVLTDGDPTDITREDLRTMAEEYSRKNKQKIIGVGLGDGTSAVVEAFPIGLGDLKVEDISKTLSKLIALMIKHPNLSDEQIQKNIELLKTGSMPKGLSLIETGETMKDLKNLFD